MRVVLQLWNRPWAMAGASDRHRLDLSGPIDLNISHRASLWVYSDSKTEIVVNGKKGSCEDVVGFGLQTSTRQLQHLPLPLRQNPGLKIVSGPVLASVTWASLPERPPSKLVPQTPQEHASYALFQRAQSVWERLRDVDSALGDPAQLWEELRRRWTKEDDSEPHMDLIVRQALALDRTLNELEKSPRRTLRRTHQQVAVSRVQEMDRRAMTWLVRQPGETLAERAGDGQKILAVTREENFDSLENRVLRSYCELAQHVAAGYLKRNNRKRLSVRGRKVAAFAQRCKRLARGLVSIGVRSAEPSAIPNFVLQQNPNYQAVWEAWHQLLSREQILDDLWRWQARSWEEYCALAVMVALVNVPGAKLVASAPLTFLEEQNRGSWLSHDNPLGAFFLPTQELVVEVRYRINQPGSTLSDFGAPIWIRIGRTDDVTGFLANIPVWPIWDRLGGLVEGEAHEIKQIVSQGKRAALISGIVLRPSAADCSSENTTLPGALTLTIGTEGEALWSAITTLSDFLVSQFFVEGRR